MDELFLANCLNLDKVAELLRGVQMHERDRAREFPKFPKLETERLLLREITSEDAAWYFRHFSTKEIVTGQGFPAPRSLQEARKELKIYFVHVFNSRSGFRWGIELKGQKGLVGSAGFYKWQKPEGLQAELGYDLDPGCWGKGIMTEALNAVVDFGFRRMKLRRIEVLIMKRNRRSARLVRRIGFVREGTLREHGVDENMKIVDDVLYSMLRKDWLRIRRV